MAAPVFRAITAYTTFTGQNVVVNKPAGVVDGDFMLVYLRQDGTVSGWNSVPSGWTELSGSPFIDGNNRHRFAIFWKIASSEPSSWTWQSTSSVTWDHFCIAYSGTTATPVEASLNGAGNLTNPATAPSITSGGAGRKLVCIWSCWEAKPHTNPAGMTQRFTETTPNSVAISDQSVEAGATGVRDDTLDSTVARWASLSLLLVGANTAPTAPVITAPNGGETIDASVNVTWTAATDAEQAQSTLQYHLQYWNNSTWVDIVALTSAGAISYSWNTSALPAGSFYKVRARAWDGLLFGPYDESNAAFTIQHNVLPLAPTGLSPTQYLYDAETNRLSWTHNDPGDPQVGFELSHRTGAGAFTVVTQTTANQFYDLPDSYNAGQIVEWKVKTSDAVGYGPYSASVTPTVITRAAVNVTAPTGTVTNTNKPPVEWAMTGGTPQYSYHARVFTAAQYGIGGFDPTTSPATWDSGVVVGSATTYTGSTVLPNATTYRAYVRLTGHSGTNVSPWDFEQFTLNLTPPTAPTLYLDTDLETGVVTLTAYKTHYTATYPTTRLEIEYQDSTQPTWATLFSVSWDSNTQISVEDVPIRHGVTRSYRAFTVATVA